MANPWQLTMKLERSKTRVAMDNAHQGVYALEV